MKKVLGSTLALAVLLWAMWCRGKTGRRECLVVAQPDLCCSPGWGRALMSLIMVLAVSRRGRKALGRHGQELPPCKSGRASGPSCCRCCTMGTQLSRAC